MEVVNGRNDQSLFRQSSVINQKLLSENRPFKTHIDLSDISPEMTFEKWCVVLNEIKEAGVLYIEFVGLTERIPSIFWELMEECQRMGFYTALFTSGVGLNEEAISRLDSLEVSNVALGLHSMNTNVHNQIAKIKDSHENIMNVIDLLNDYQISFSLNCLLTKMNIDHFYELEDWANINNYLIKVDAFTKFRKYYLSDSEDLSPNISQLQNYYLERSKRESWHYFERSETLRGHICDAGKARCAINGKGELFSCIEITEPIGSLLKESFFNLWKNKRSNHWRNIRKSDLKNFSCSSGFSCDHCPGESKRKSGNEFIVLDHVNSIQKVKNNILKSTKV